MRDEQPKITYADYAAFTASVLLKFRLDIEAALWYGLRGLDFDTVCMNVISGEYSIKPLPNSVIIGTDQENPNGSKCHHIIVAAGDLDEIRGALPNIYDAARERGCTDVRYAGRRGWLRALPDLEEVAVVGVKKL